MTINQITASAFSDYSEGSLKWRAQVYREFGPDRMHLSREFYKVGTNTYIDVKDALIEAKRNLEKMLIWPDVS